VIVRFFTVKSVKAVRISACWTLSFIAIIYLTAPALGLFARMNIVEEIDGQAYRSAPEWFTNWEAQGMVAWVDKNNDGLMAMGKGVVFSGKPIATESDSRGEHGQRLVQNVISDDANEVYYDRDIIVLANPEVAGLPPWVIALVMAGCVAAALSTAAGLLLVLSTSISHDLMKKVVKPDLSDKEEVMYARMASFGALVLAAYFGINPPADFVAKTVAFAFGLAASSFFPTILLGIFTRRTNQLGAISGMISGMSFTAGYIIYFQFIADHTDYWLGISPEGIGFVGMLLNFAVAIGISAVTSPPPQAVQDMVENIRVPNNAGASSH
jgi:cation/acetate symporter